MLTAAQIVEQYYDFIRSKAKVFFRDNSLADDLTNDVSLILLEKNADQLNELMRTGGMEGYIFMVVRNQAINENNRFARHKSIRVEVVHDDGIDRSEDAIQQAIASMHKLSNFEQRILSFLMEGCNPYQIHKRTGASRTLIKKTVKSIREKLTNKTG